ncbi:MAG: HD domain-containing protein, partial [Firmicutes bacterium]|nr:HD domain-containing protein [Bacillota bacterium]
MDDMTERAIEYINALFASDSGGHDAEHSLRVYRNTLRIAENEPGCELRIAALAALLHDADDPKLFDTGGNANARAFLEASGVPAEDIERICGAINSV